MEVEGISSQVLPTIQTSQTEPTVEEPPQEQPQSSETTETETTSGEMQGVIRNLLEGHFKGVADIRLRINNCEQLAIIAEENLKAAAEAEIASLLDTIDSGLNNLPDSSEPLTAEEAPQEPLTAEGAPQDNPETATVTGLHQEFGNEVNQLNEEFQSAQPPSTDDLVIGIEGAFSVFIGALQDLLAPTPEDNSSVDKDAVTTTDDEPQATESTDPDYQSLLGEIEDAFAAAIAELMEALNAIQAPPELSEPSGNGTAYEKFLAVYNEMWGIGADQDNTASSGNVDMTG